MNKLILSLIIIVFLMWTTFAEEDACIQEGYAGECPAQGISRCSGNNIQMCDRINDIGKNCWNSLIPCNNKTCTPLSSTEAVCRDTSLTPEQACQQQITLFPSLAGKVTGPCSAPDGTKTCIDGKPFQCIAYAVGSCYFKLDPCPQGYTCENGNCIAGQSCPDNYQCIDDYSLRHYFTNCSYEDRKCSNGCDKTSNRCREDVCPNKCENNVMSYQATYSNGKCEWKKEECKAGCNSEGTVCARVPRCQDYGYVNRCSKTQEGKQECAGAAGDKIIKCKNVELGKTNEYCWVIINPEDCDNEGCSPGDCGKLTNKSCREQGYEGACDIPPANGCKQVSYEGYGGEFNTRMEYYCKSVANSEGKKGCVVKQRYCKADEICLKEKREQCKENPEDKSCKALHPQNPGEGDYCVKTIAEDKTLASTENKPNAATPINEVMPPQIRVMRITDNGNKLVDTATVEDVLNVLAIIETPLPLLTYDYTLDYTLVKEQYGSATGPTKIKQQMKCDFKKFGSYRCKDSIPIEPKDLDFKLYAQPDNSDIKSNEVHIVGQKAVCRRIFGNGKYNIVYLGDDSFKNGSSNTSSLNNIEKIVNELWAVMENKSNSIKENKDLFSVYVTNVTAKCKAKGDSQSCFLPQEAKKACLSVATNKSLENFAILNNLPERAYSIRSAPSYEYSPMHFTVPVGTGYESEVVHLHEFSHRVLELGDTYCGDTGYFVSDFSNIFKTEKDCELFRIKNSVTDACIGICNSFEKPDPSYVQCTQKPCTNYYKIRQSSIMDGSKTEFNDVEKIQIAKRFEALKGELNAG